MKQYQIALTSVIFDNSYSNTIRFNNRAEQIEYFNINSLSFSPFINFDFGNMLYTNIVYRDENITNTDLLNKNYAIIKEIENENIKYYFYFINNNVYDNNNQILCDLELDVIQTYYIDIEFTNSMIFKAHLDRFKTINETQVKFDNSLTSLLYEREDIKNISKRLIKRDKLTFNYDTLLENDFNKWLNDNVYCWIYIYISSGEYKYYKITDGSMYELNSGDTLFKPKEEIPTILNYIRKPYQIYCYPIYKSDKIIKIVNSSTNVSEIRSFAFDNFKLNNNIDSAIFQMKLSAVAPFTVDEYEYGTTEQKYSLSDGNLTLYVSSTADNILNYFNQLYFYRTDDINTESLIVVGTENKSNTLISDYIITEKKQVFLKNEIVGSLHNMQFNPKLLNDDYFELRITNLTDFTTYDLQKIGADTTTGLTKLRIGFTEDFSADITRQYIRNMPLNNDGIYIIDTSKNLTGLVSTQDNSIPYSINQLNQYLAQNKNFYLQRNISSISSLTNSVSSALNGNYAGSIMNGLNVGVDRIQSNLTIDNMKNAPESLRNSNGAPFLNLCADEMGIYVELYSALYNELVIADDYMNMYGFNFNTENNIKNYDNIRKYFNYIQADVELIKGVNLNNTIRNKIKKIFNNGIRFWNVTDKMFDYTYENYERWLE